MQVAAASTQCCKEGTARSMQIETASSDKWNSAGVLEQAPFLVVDVFF